MGIQVTWMWPSEKLLPSTSELVLSFGKASRSSRQSIKLRVERTLILRLGSEDPESEEQPVEPRGQYGE